uniref:SET domain-containing protein n=1 Tax=Nothobranchius furzeri TaxID=105023 RepID=A0A8C6LT84_NOTFU
MIFILKGAIEKVFSSSFLESVTMIRGKAKGWTKMSRKELSDTDDLATSLVLDPLLGFPSHKINLSPQSVIQFFRKALSGITQTTCPLLSHCYRYSSEINGAKYMCPTDSHLLRAGVTYFSVMYSTRKKCMQLWLGPATFINHDCKPNCKYVPVERNVEYAQVIQTTLPRDELTRYYDDGYEICECCTCERNGTGRVININFNSSKLACERAADTVGLSSVRPSTGTEKMELNTF